jgi:mannose-6-phosphate isomerase-like protein (cupin superfamily)
MRATHPFMVLPGASRTQGPKGLGGEISFKVSERDTDGVWTLFETSSLPYAGPPLHFHRRQDEWFYVLKEKHRFRIGSDEYTVQAGGSIFAPRMIPHTWENTGVEPGKLLILLQPAGRFEEFLIEFPALARESAAGVAVDRLFEKYDMELVGPPLSSPVQGV